MRAFILAAGLGTRLRPFTLEHPKALVPVGGEPILAHVIKRLKSEGGTEIVVNVHHFADQIEEYLAANSNFGLTISISDERRQLLDTGGAILQALRRTGWNDNEGVLIHNVDILSDAPLRKLVEAHADSGAAATLLVSRRESSRRLAFDADSHLRGWVDMTSGLTRPEGFMVDATHQLRAFSGIHVISPAQILAEMERQQREGVFSVIDFYLHAAQHIDVRGWDNPELKLIDIGKPATLSQADSFINKLK